jgi:hypothetical protein
VASSSRYWFFAENAKDELVALAALAEDAYTSLESSDDPADLADSLSDIRKRMDKLSEQLGPAIPMLRKAATALENIPVLKGSN